MNANSRFIDQFQMLIASGGHMVASIMDGQRSLQVSEIYGGEVILEGKAVRLFSASDVVPEFYKSLSPQKKLALVICSPFSMEAYQVKGSIIEIGLVNESHLSISEYWRENYLQCLKSIGVSKLALDNVIYRPDYFFSMELERVFLQSPLKNTGNEL